MALPIIFDVRSPQVIHLYRVLDICGPATAWTALHATGSIASSPVSLVKLLNWRLRKAPVYALDREQRRRETGRE